MSSSYHSIKKGDSKKQGRNLTRQQKIHIASYRLNPDNWMISKKLADEWLIIHRLTGRSRTIPAP
ncbi:DUF6906 family protein [Lysinibacillus sphaericus]|uniref:DUF6906 family protein n=1 Tax=Lysinibacillus sphaericus TaxID=1421 RepID=UPI0003A95CF2|nr:hypothetical protein [Lysinibacillus sphaericus]